MASVSSRNRAHFLFWTTAGVLSALFQQRLTAGALPTVEFTATAFVVAENAGSLTVRVVRRGDLAGSSAVSFSASNGTAVAGVEFTADAGRLTFGPGEASKMFSVPLLDDNLWENNRFFSLHLFDPTNAALGWQSIAIVTIVDDEFSAVLDPWFDPAQGADNDIFAMALTPEGRIVLGGQFVAFNQAPGLRSVAVLLPDGRIDPAFEMEDGSPNGPVYAVVLQPNGDILIGGDFTAVGAFARPYVARLTRSGALDSGFAPAGINNGVRTILLQPDGGIFIAGRFTEVAGQSRARIARLNADGSLDMTFDPGTGANNSIRALALQPDGRVLIGGQFATFAGISRNGIARLMANGALDSSFNPGVGADDEVRSVALRPDGAILIGGDFENYNGVARSSVARLFPDGALDPAFDPGPSDNDFVRVVSPAPGGKVWIGGRFTYAGGATRYNLALLETNGLADAFAPGVVEQEVFALLTQPDGQTLVSGDFISINGISRRRIARLNTGRPPPQIRCDLSDAVTEERAAQIVLTVLRQGDFAVVAETDYQTSDGTAQAGADYSALVGSVRFEPMEAAKLIAIPILNDSLMEPAETFSFRLTNPASPATLGAVTSTVVTIQDDDTGFEFAADTLGGSEPAGSATITVRRGGTGMDTVSVDYRIVPGTAQSGIDYLATNGTLVFQPGETQKTFAVTIIADAVAEGPETVLLTLTNASANAVVGARRAATLRIEDVDSTFEWGYVSVGAEPGGGEMFAVVERRGVMSLPATVEYETADGTATAGADYVAASGTLTFAPGQAYATFAPGQTYLYFDLTILNDGLVEDTETVRLRLRNPTGGAVLGPASNSVVVIGDNDASIAFVETNIVVSENSASVTLNVARYDDGTNSLTVDYFTSDGTARAGVNYVSRSVTLSLPAPLGSNTVIIPLLDECVLMGQRVFTVALRNPSTGGSIGSNGVAVVTVRGNDQPGSRDLSFSPVFSDAQRLLVLADGSMMLAGVPTARPNLFSSLLVHLGKDGSLAPDQTPEIGPGAIFVAVTALAQGFDGRILFAEVLFAPEEFIGFVTGVGFFRPPAVGSISTIALQPDGRIVLGGDFESFDGDAPLAPSGVARRNADGSRDETFNPGTGAFASDSSFGVGVVALDSQGKIFVGGFFTSFDGVPRPGLARLQTNGALDLTFDPGGGPTNAAGPNVACILPLPDGKTLVGGGFTHVNGVARSGVARLRDDGSVDAAFNAGPVSGGGVGKIIRQPNGQLFIFGTFTSVDGRHRGGIALLHADGSLDLSFDPGSEDYRVVDCGLQPDGRIVSCGKTATCD